jgi:hypothetical protein
MNLHKVGKVKIGNPITQDLGRGKEYASRDAHEYRTITIYDTDGSPAMILNVFSGYGEGQKISVEMPEHHEDPPSVHHLTQKEMHTTRRPPR